MLEIYQGTWVQSFSKQQKKNTEGGVQFVCTVRTLWDRVGEMVGKSASW